VSAVLAAGVFAYATRGTLKATDFTLNGANGTMPRRRGIHDQLSGLQHESAADRILLTLLALVLMLLAFFVVLTSASSVDQLRVHGVVKSVQATFERSVDDAALQVPQSDPRHRAAVGILRAAVADIFAQIIFVDRTAQDAADPDSDRVEVDVPMAAFFAEEATTLGASPVLDKIAAIAALPPSGYRMEIVARAAVKSHDIEIGQERIAALAMSLMQRGVPVTMLSVGMLDDIKVDDQRSPTLRFTFLLLDDGDSLAGVHALAKPSAAKAAAP